MSPQERSPRTLAEPLSHLDISRVNITDSDGIPKSSDRVAPELMEGIDWDYRGCPYGGSPSRMPHGQPHEVPMSFLERERLIDNYPAMMGVVEQIRTAFCETKRIEGSLGTYDVRILLDALAYLPTYLALHGQKNISPQGELPPALIVLSNSASGALGALGSFEEIHLQDPPEVLLGVPDVEEMIQQSEMRRTMIGEKTVCAASPVMMKRFIDSVIHGDEPRTEFRLDIWEYISPDELPALLSFGQSMEFCRTIPYVIELQDMRFAEQLTENFNRGHSDRRIRQTVANYVAEVGTVMRAVTAHQVNINACLVREPVSPPLSVKDYEVVCNLEMLNLLERLTGNQVPMLAIEEEQKNAHVTIALGDSIFRLLAQHQGHELPAHIR